MTSKSLTDRVLHELQQRELWGSNMEQIVRQDFSHSEEAFHILAMVGGIHIA